MSYEQWRLNAVRNAYSQTVREFLSHYDPTRPTVVLLPGGMGSQLDRSLEKYHKAGGPQPSEYDTVWIDVGIIFNNDGLKLAIDARGRDRDGHAIIPNGALRFYIDAYDETKNYFAGLGWNFVTFGYDWRRSLVESATNLKMFLTLLREAVWRKHKNNPLPNTSLLAHSQGGLVAKLFLDKITDTPSWIDKVITVGTPFYGTSLHQQRYFVGQDNLNELYGNATVAKIVSTLPGPYILMFLDNETFLRDGQQIGLRTYPITDADTGEIADPYNISESNRYPNWVNSAHIVEARNQRHTITKALAAPVQEKVFTLRSSLNPETPNTLSWQRIDNSFDPDSDPSPISVESIGGGDGTVPRWSAWLPSLPENHKVDLKIAKDHTYIMEHKEVLEIAQGIIENGTVPTDISLLGEVQSESSPIASPEEIVKFLADVRECRTDRADERSRDPAMWRGLARSFIA